MHYLEKTTIVPSSLSECWNFFSSPKNLNKITPPSMDFKITSTSNIKEMYEGMMITYTVKPLLGIKIKWASEITKIAKESYFIDEQREGPYAIWHHEHHFEEVVAGVKMTDKIYYSMPFGILGRIAQFLFVRKQVEGIFKFREKKIVELFGKLNE